MNTNKDLAVAPSSSQKLVYFWDEITEENADLFGQKCARLSVAKHAGMPVPPFFAIALDGTRQILEHNGISEDLDAQIKHCMGRLEKETGRSFTDPSNPLVTAVRSGDPVSMAGAMFSYLNVGVNEQTIPALVDQYKNKAAFLHMYLDSVVDHAFTVERQPREEFTDILDGIRDWGGDRNELKDLIGMARRRTPSFKDDVIEQLSTAIVAVALSWQNFATSAFREEMELEKDADPSIFVQQMAFGNLQCSGFLAFCTHNPVSGANELHGDFALGTEGRRMMRGIGPERLAIEELAEHFPDIAPQVANFAKRAESLFRRPQDVEAVIEKNKLKLVQIVDAFLAPNARRTIKLDLRARGVLKPKESIPPIPGIARTRVIKTHKLRPDAELKLIAQGVPTHPGAVEGRLALCAADAIRLGIRRGDNTVLLLQEPDERVLPMLLKRQIEGFAATYASTHDYAAAMLSHVPSVMSVDVETENHNYLIAPDGMRIPVGKRVILDGTTGNLYMAPPLSESALIEDKPILVTPHELVGYEIEKETRAKYGDRSYEELLAEHARFVKEIKDFAGEGKATGLPKEETIKYAELELETHFIHLIIFELAADKGLTYYEAQLDVAVADGSLDRVPGLEHKQIVLERADDALTLILGTEVNYEHETIESHAYSRDELRKLKERLELEGVEYKFYVKQTKLSRHTQYVSTTCLQFAPERLENVVRELRRVESVR